MLFAAVDRWSRDYACSFDTPRWLPPVSRSWKRLKSTRLKLKSARLRRALTSTLARETGLVASVLNRAREPHMGRWAKGVETGGAKGAFLPTWDASRCRASVLASGPVADFPNGCCSSAGRWLDAFVLGLMPVRENIMACAVHMTCSNAARKY